MAHTLIQVGTHVRATRLVNFNGSYAEYHVDGIAYICIKRRGNWFVTADYYYL